MKEYPEHEKLEKVAPTSQEIGGFLDWLQNTEGVVMCKIYDDELVPTYEPIQNLLARYFEIDLNKIESEKREMLRRLREER